MKTVSFLGTVIAVSAAIFLAQNASAQTITLESWEGSLDGWTLQAPGWTYAPSPIGVTDGSYSAALTGTNSPNYGQMLLSPFEASWTAAFGGATSLKLDVFTFPGSFGNFLQFDIDINNADTGFVSLDSYSYPATVIGSETMITVPVSPALAAILAASTHPTQIAIQIGGGNTPGNQTMYLDNLRVVPEPSTFALLGFGVIGLVGVARRRRVS